MWLWDWQSEIHKGGSWLETQAWFLCFSRNSCWESSAFALKDESHPYYWGLSAVFKLKSNVDICHIYKIPSERHSTLLFDQASGHYRLAKLTHEILPSQWVSLGSSYLHRVREALQITILDLCILTSILPRCFGLMCLGFWSQACPWVPLAPCSSPVASLCFVPLSSLSQHPGPLLILGHRFWTDGKLHLKELWKNSYKGLGILNKQHSAFFHYLLFIYYSVKFKYYYIIKFCQKKKSKITHNHTT